MRSHRKRLAAAAAALLTLALVSVSRAAELATPDWYLASMTPALYRTSAALAYDGARDVTVLFGGRFPDLLGDTWECHGGTWTPVSPPHAPSPRFWHAMAYDSNRQRIVLFGGGDPGAGLYSAETWEFDGSDWQLIDTPNSPAGRTGHAMAFDSARDRIVLFGGENAGGGFSDTWEYDGADWTLAATATSPPAMSLVAMAFDAARARTVLVLYDGGPGAATWEYDGVDWVAATSAARPSGRWAVSPRPSPS